MSADMSAFFAVHAGLPRQGPGTPSDVAWACAAAGLARDGVVCDAACGPGADIAALRDAAPDGRFVAFDLHLPFVAEAALRHGAEPGVQVTQGALVAKDGLPDPVELGPFDLIWCAGAVYFEGVAGCLNRWHSALRPGGAVAFSHPVLFGAPDAETRRFWDGYPAADEAALDAEIAACGWGVVARSRVTAEGWEAYYQPLEERCARLAAADVPALRLAVEQSRQEAALWRQVRDRTGYALRVVRPT